MGSLQRGTLVATLRLLTHANGGVDETSTPSYRGQTCAATDVRPAPERAARPSSNQRGLRVPVPRKDKTNAGYWATYLWNKWWA